MTAGLKAWDHGAKNMNGGHSRYTFGKNPGKQKSQQSRCPTGRSTLLAQMQYRLRVHLAFARLHKNQLYVYDNMVCGGCQTFLCEK